MNKSTYCSRIFTYGVRYFIKLVLCRILCIVFSLVIGFLTASLGESLEVSQTAELWKPAFVSQIFFTLAAVHIYGIASMFMKLNNFEKRRKREQYGVFSLILAYYEKFFGPHGKYGIFGPEFESILLLREVSEIPTQSYLAYQMSFLISDSWLPTVLASIIVMNCTLLPLILQALPFNRTKRRTCALVLDILLDLFMGIFLPLAVVLPPALDYIDSPFNRTSFPWSTDSISRSRYVYVSSPMDLIATTLPILGCHMYLSTLHYAWSYEAFTKSTVKTSVVPCKSSNEIVVSRSRRQSWHKILGYLSVVWAIALAVIVVDSFGHKKCSETPMATLPLSPWLATKGQCYTLMLSVDHVKQSQYSMEEIVSTIERDFNLDIIRTVSFARCPNKDTPGVIQKMKNLQILIYKFSQLTSLTLDFQILPSIFAIIIMSNPQIKEVPPSLKQIPPSVFRLMLINNPLGELPDWASQSWRNVKSLFLSGAQLRNVSIVATLPQVEELDIGENLLDSVPAEFENAFLSMKELALRGNNLKSIPNWPSLAEIPYINLDYNDIRSLNDIPWSIVEINERKRSATSLLSLSFNPICNDPLLENATIACVNDCAPLCNSFRHNDFVCHMPCNVCSCSYDNGQCTTNFA